MQFNISIDKNSIKLPNAKMVIDLALSEIANQISNRAWELSPFKSGTLRRSIMAQRVNWELYRVITNNIPYAKIQEYWGYIYPKSKKMLSFMVWWKRVFAKKVYIKPKWYFKWALEDISPKVSDILWKIIQFYT